MMIFNVETHGDIRVCPICRRYIVTIANSPHPVARPRICPPHALSNSNSNIPPKQPTPNAVGTDHGYTTDSHGGLMSRHATTRNSY